MNTVDNIGLILGATSTVVAIISLVFAWKAVKTAEKSNASAMFTELHKIYLDDRTFKAIQKVWQVYSEYQEDAERTPVTYQKAYGFVSEYDRQSEEWKAVHDMTLFWKYVSILVRKGYLEEDIAFEVFTSPRMLGFLAPIERAFIEHHGGEVNEDSAPVIWLYNRYKEYVEKE
jgi:hypothetical protein